jgi:hypothetical protein
MHTLKSLQGSPASIPGENRKNLARTWSRLRRPVFPDEHLIQQGLRGSQQMRRT